jgi:hypothetical protein
MFKFLIQWGGQFIIKFYANMLYNQHGSVQQTFTQTI